MIICDICKNEITGDVKKINLPYKKENTALEYKDLDLCDCCDIRLKRKIIELKYEFVKNGGK